MKDTAGKLKVSGGSEADGESLEDLRAKLAKAEEEIATLQSELKSKQATIIRLLSADLRSNAQLVEVTEMVWQYHREQPEPCECEICKQVERSHSELGDLT